MAATAVTVLHPAPQEAFDPWCAQVRAAALAFGAASVQVGAVEVAGYDRAVSFTFGSEDQLHQWLDSPARAAVFEAGQGQGVWRKHADLVLSEGAALPYGVAVIDHVVEAGKEDEFRQAQRHLVEACAAFPGFEGAAVLPHGAGRWLAVLRFRTDRQLASWLQSPQRAALLPELRSKLTEDFAVAARSTPFGSILRVADGRTEVTPNWKTAMLVLLVLYPTVMLLSRFLGPVLDGAGAPPWLALWLSQIASVGLMTWYFMPVVTGWFARWLDPVDGRGWRVSLAGALVVVVAYTATLALFASVKWLQFWDYMD